MDHVEGCQRQTGAIGDRIDRLDQRLPERCLANDDAPIVIDLLRPQDSLTATDDGSVLRITRGSGPSQRLEDIELPASATITVQAGEATVSRGQQPTTQGWKRWGFVGAEGGGWRAELVAPEPTDEAVEPYCVHPGALAAFGLDDERSLASEPLSTGATPLGRVRDARVALEPQFARRLGQQT